MKKGFLIDMDGVIYRSSQLIAGAVDFIRVLRDWEIPFLFLTNNSQRTRRDVATKLQRMGMPVEEEHIFTCAMATARFLARQKPQGTAFVIGEGGLLNALHLNGYSVVDKSPDYVVVGEGRTLSFEMLEHAVQMVIDGAKLIATNLDPNCPTQTGTRPGCGAIVSLIEAATGIKAFSVGKPSPVMMRTAQRDRHGHERNHHDRRHDGNRHLGRRPDGLSHGPRPHRQHEARRPLQLRLPARYDRRLDCRPLRPGAPPPRSLTHHEPRRRHAARHPRVGGHALVTRVGQTFCLPST